MMREAKEQLKSVSIQQFQNLRALWRLVQPVRVQRRERPHATSQRHRQRHTCLPPPQRLDSPRYGRAPCPQVIPSVINTCLLGMLTTILRAKFHQLGVWMAAIEAGVAGDLELASSRLFQLWVGHMLIKLLELPESTYMKRAKAFFGATIRNGVLTAMTTQDYEYFDRTSAGVLQARARTHQPPDPSTR